MEFTIKDKLTFGKYKGQIIEDIWKKDKHYLGWAMINVKFFNFIMPTSSEKIEELNMTYQRNQKLYISRFSRNNNSYYGDRNSYADEFNEEGWGIPNH